MDADDARDNRPMDVIDLINAASRLFISITLSKDGYGQSVLTISADYHPQQDFIDMIIDKCGAIIKAFEAFRSQADLKFEADRFRLNGIPTVFSLHVYPANSAN